MLSGDRRTHREWRREGHIARAPWRWSSRQGRAGPQELRGYAGDGPGDAKGCDSRPSASVQAPRQGCLIAAHALQTASHRTSTQTIAITVRSAPLDDILGLVCRAFRLSTRERELVTLVAQGKETPAIAELMAISRYTVQDHLKSIFDKLGVHSRLELVTQLLAQVA